MLNTSGEAEYSIAAVSKLTGVSCHALRVWERRYGFPIPRRSASGHRRYGADQVAVLRQLARLSQAGEPIGDLIDALKAGRLRIDPNEVVEMLGEPGDLTLIDRLLEGDLAGAETEYAVLTEGLDPVQRIVRVIEPLLIETGERWFRGDCDVFQEHLASSFLRRKLQTMIEDVQQRNRAPKYRAIVGTVQGDRHEGGALIVALLLELSGWRALYLGVDLPIREYRKAVELWRPDALCVSFVLSRNINKRCEELSQLNGVPVFVGGRSILNYRSLVRRHGLIPLPGSGVMGVDRMIHMIQNRNGKSAIVSDEDIHAE